MLRLSVFIVALACSVSAACPQFETVQNLDLKQFSGDWKVQGLMRTLAADPNMECLHVELLSSNWEASPVTARTIVHGIYAQNDVEFNQEYSATVPREDSGRWNVNANGTAVSFSILETDYTGYALTVTCYTIPELNVDDINVFVKSRTFDPIPQNVTDEFFSKLESTYGFTGSYYTIEGDEDTCEDHTHP